MKSSQMHRVRQITVINGRIEFYDAGGNLVGLLTATPTPLQYWGDANGARVQIEPGQLTVYNEDGDEFMTVLGTGAAPSFRLQQRGNPDVEIILSVGTAGDRPQIILNDGTSAVGALIQMDTDGDGAGLLTFESPTQLSGNDAQMEMRSDDGVLTDPELCLLGRTMPRINRSGAGFVKQTLSMGPSIAPFSSTGNNGPHTGTTVTDMVLTNVPVIAGEWYRFDLLTQWLLSAAVGQWFLELRRNGAIIGRMARPTNLAAAALRDVAAAPFWWQAPTTGATDDFDIIATEASGAADLTLEGGAAFPRQFSVAHVGGLP
jgi:hypothetical protein